MNFIDIFIPVAHAHGSPALDSASTSFLFQHNVPFSTISGTLMLIFLMTAVVLGLTLFYKQCRSKAAKKITIIQKMAWAYAAMFFATTSLTYLPGLADDMGNFMGLFKLDLIDDLLHFGSGVWAMWAAWHSTKQSLIYFKVFGSVYALDGLIGLITQRGILDFGVWLYEFPNLSLAANVGANLPHILIGGIALFTGFVLGNKFKNI